jgi:hypothetical protein
MLAAIRHHHGIPALALTCALSAAAFAHGDAEWIQKNPDYVDKFGYRCCSPNDCERIPESFVREDLATLRGAVRSHDIASRGVCMPAKRRPQGKDGQSGRYSGSDQQDVPDYGHADHKQGRAGQRHPVIS